MSQLSLRNNRLNFKTSGKLPTILGESIEYTSYLNSKNKRYKRVTGQTWKHQDLNRLCPKISTDIGHYTRIPGPPGDRVDYESTLNMIFSVVANPNRLAQY